GVRIAGAIAGGDIQHAIEAEGQVAAVMAGRAPFDNHLFGFRIDARGRAGLDAEARDAVGSLGFRRRTVGEDVDQVVRAVAEVETDRVNDPLFDFEGRRAPLDVRIVLKTHDPRGLFAVGV